MILDIQTGTHKGLHKKVTEMLPALNMLLLFTLELLIGIMFFKFGPQATKLREGAISFRSPNFGHAVHNFFNLPSCLFCEFNREL